MAKHARLKVYWIILANPPDNFVHQRGIGVTALGKADAIDLVREHVDGAGSPEYELVVCEVLDFQELDQNHVVPNMGNHLRRGVWYPDLYWT